MRGIVAAISPVIEGTKGIVLRFIDVQCRAQISAHLSDAFFFFLFFFFDSINGTDIVLIASLRYNIFNSKSSVVGDNSKRKNTQQLY